jgi:hypothetical protein
MAFLVPAIEARVNDIKTHVKQSQVPTVHRGKRSLMPSGRMPRPMLAHSSSRQPGSSRCRPLSRRAI